MGLVTQIRWSWHGEAFFGQLLNEEPRAVSCREAFVYPIQAGGESIQKFMIVSEFMAGGDLSGYLTKNGPWQETRAVREALGLMGVLERLHALGILHRDLTPKNILVDRKGRLRIADFGIARMSYRGSEVKADFRNPLFVTGGHLHGKHRTWGIQDDVFQFGQIMAMLLTGIVGRMVSTKEIKELPCSERLRGVLEVATGPRAKRYGSIAQMRSELEGRKQLRITNLQGKRVVVTGPLSIPRDEAHLRITQAGGIVQDKVRSNTDLLVAGKPSPHYAGGGRRGTKLKKAKGMGMAGREIPCIGEQEFLTLVKRGVGRKAGSAKAHKAERISS